MEDFVPFSFAKKLKEKGFNYETRDVYERNTLACRYEDIPKPTISQVLKWLREEKNIFVVTFIADDSDTPLTYEIYMGTGCLLTHHGKYFTLQEWDKCNLAGIEYIIDNNLI